MLFELDANSMSYYSYKITRDYGFAPNPFFGLCTLACCKPHIRKKAEVGDWIIGTGATANSLLYRLIFVMKVSEKLSFEEYWADRRFARKKPVLNGSLAQIHGDNIYHKENESWCQLDSHHSFHEGELNKANMEQDTNGEFVLVSDHFIYWGANHLNVPEQYRSLCCSLRDYCTIEDHALAEEFLIEMKKQYSLGVHGDPVNWNEYTQLSLF
jgi:hypothetical protein